MKCPVQRLYPQEISRVEDDQAIVREKTQLPLGCAHKIKLQYVMNYQRTKLSKSKGQKTPVLGC